MIYVFYKLVMKDIHSIDKNQFKRLLGIDKKTFKYMVKILEEADIKKKKLGGRPSKLSIEQKLLLTLQYWREYRTYFAIGQDFKISESYCYKTVIWVEDTLVKSRAFALPNAKEVMKEKILVIDATESKIERPKRGQKKFTLAKRSSTRLKPR